MDLQSVKKSIQTAIWDCSLRGLNFTAKWLAELNDSLSHIKVELSDWVCTDTELFGAEYDLYLLAKSYFDTREYDRCTHFTEKSTTPVCRFLHFYSKYLSLERKTVEDTTNDWPDPKQNSKLQELLTSLRTEYLNWKLDCYLLYLYGVVLKRHDLHNEAIQVLVEAIHKDPLHWGVWTELAALIPSKEKLKSLLLPDHWMKQFFLALTYLEQQLNDESLEIYKQLQKVGFQQSNYLLAQIAIAHHNKRDVDKAISVFMEVRKRDPLRIDNLDIYSNLLYVKEMNAELSQLAHQATDVDKYRPETCCIIGNFYSLRTEHQKAVLYFQRALRVNPQYMSAWTLMGHEYMEMKNINAAIQSYRQAIDVNRRDYRAWYGLGQTYEILKLFSYCVYYYHQAHRLRPSDNRMLVALGETYEKLDKVPTALQYYHRARNVGDIDAKGVATFRMAKLFEKIQLHDQALTLYKEYIREARDPASSENSSELAHSYKYVANQYLMNNELELAQRYAKLSLDFIENKEEGKACLNAICLKRSQQNKQTVDVSMQAEEDSLLSSWHQSTETDNPIGRVLMFSPESNQ